MNEKSAGQSEMHNGSEADRLVQLRKLLVSPEQQRQIALLQEQLDAERVSAERVSKVLPDAIRRSAAQDERFARSLGPTLSEAFKASIKRDPHGLVDTIAPIMGPAIRRSIVQAIRAMVQSLNTTLEHSLSAKGLKWRIEGWRTGKSFAEVVLLHTLLYRIEQLLLVHNETGLLLCHVSAEPVEDADVVSSMLTAIQDFVHDSFRSTEELRTMDCGGLTVWIEQGPKARLAAAVRGEPPITLRENLQEALENIHIEQSPELENFNGDNQPFEQSRIHLEACLDYEYKRDSAESGRRYLLGRLLWLVPVVVLLGAMMWGILAWNQKRQQRQLAQWLELPPTATLRFQDGVFHLSGRARHDWIVQATDRIQRLPRGQTVELGHLEDLDAAWIRYVQLLRNEPGIVITSTRYAGDRQELHGLRDPLAKDPESLRQKAGLEAGSFSEHWQPYQCLEDQFVLTRAHQQLKPPKGVQLRLSDGRLQLEGTASDEWIQRVGIVASLVSGVREVDVSNLRSNSYAWQKYLARLAEEPGVTVMTEQLDGGNFVVRGLRDPLAADPHDLIDAKLLDPSRVVGHWATYESLDPQIVLRRARSLLQPPPEVAVELHEDTLRLSGAATHDWVQNVKRVGRLSGVRRIDTIQLRDVELERLDKLKSWIEKQAVYSQSGTAQLADEQLEWVSVLAEEIKKLNAAAQSVGHRVQIEIVGTNPASLGLSLSRSLGRARAEGVRDALIQAGVSPGLLSTRSDVAAAQPDHASPASTEVNHDKVTFRVGVKQTRD